MQDHRVDNFSAVDASPSKEIFMGAVEFFKSHDTLTPGTFHLSLLKISWDLHFIL